MLASRGLTQTFLGLTDAEAEECVRRLLPLPAQVAASAVVGRGGALGAGAGTVGTRAEREAATRIQAVFRGFRARKPLTLALGSPATHRVMLMLARIFRERARSGRPPSLPMMSHRQLQEEKQVVKLVLVSLDRDFRHKHGRLPSKHEKEPLRPLYRLYNEVKRLVGAHSVQRNPQSPSNSGFTDDPGLGSGAAQPASPPPPHPAPVPSPPLPFAHPSPPAPQPATVAAAFGSAGSASAAGAAALRLEDADDPRTPLLREKRRLQVKLNMFEQKFLKANGRPIRWESDILEVKADYERYKALKLELGRIDGTPPKE